MRAKIALVLFSAISLVVLTVKAGGGSEAGNGGSSIVCQDSSGKVTSVELLDFYEGRIQRGLNLDLGPNSDSVEAKLSLAIRRLKDRGMSPDAMTVLEGLTTEFANMTRFYSGVRLVEIPDSANLFIPAECRQEQIAVWKDPVVAEDRLFNVSQDLWDHLDNDNRAGLILHESLYYLSKKFNESDIADSRFVRYLVSKISSQEADTWSAVDFLNVLRNLHFKKMVYKGMVFKVDNTSPEIYADGVLGGGTLAGSQPIQVQSQTVYVDEIELDNDGNFISFSPAQAVALNVDGQNVWFTQGYSIRVNRDHIMAGAAAYNNQTVFSRPNSYHLQLNGIRKKPIELVFDQDGSLHHCNSCVGTAVFRGQTLPIGVGPQEGEDMPPISYYRSFTDDGFQAYLAHPVRLKVNSQQILFEKTFIFDTPSSYAGNKRILGVLAEDSTITVGEKHIKILKGPIEFHHSEQLRKGILAKNAIFPNLQGQLQTYLAGMEITINEEGRVEWATVADKALFEKMRITK